ncbi:response regulator transcription factor [Thiothrix nivea]|uniref:Two component transcriptional regulator, LuxR family n=1 Tax=Thiothrix nivea (strain ATCC 35100 / DSM 5205 / JP2) TaxID=870187 RepID=A0A656HCC6_THINJ|nr:response regulator transcription factor [Thiothrix nivea]EIJ33086.1 two component transcriptional regulator, LuxR family [Thiothrix nivea DSM 5205]
MQQALIVEDVPETSEWLHLTLQKAFQQIHSFQADSCRQARQILQAHCISLALLDINLPDGSGIELVPCIRERCPDAYIVITTIFDDEEHILKALKAGAHGYLLKDLPERLFIQKLRGILNGDPPISPSISRRILQYFSAERSVPQTQANNMDIQADSRHEAISLSPREREVLTLVAKGLSRPEISSLLGLSTNTVARYIRDVYQKLNISSRAEAAVEACRMGLVSTELH